MKIIRTYILKECILPFFLALSVLTCVFLLGNLIKLTNLVVNKGVSLVTVGEVFVLYIPVLLGYTLPIACLIGVIIAFSRFSVDNEIIAMRASGIHLAKLLMPLLIVGLIISLFCIILNERLIPYAHFKQRNIIKSLGRENPAALLEPGMFIHAFNDQVIFIHRIEGNLLYDVTIYQPQPSGTPRTIVAKRGEFTPVPGKNQIKLKLMNGTSDEPNLENPDNFYKLNFNTYFMTLDLGSKDNVKEKKPKSMTLKELERSIEDLEKHFINPSRLKTEYFRKITWSFSPFFFILLGFPLAVITNRREKSANIVVAMMFAVGYYLISIGCEAMSIKQIAPSAIIMWVPNIIAGLLAIILNYKCVS